MTAPKLKPFTAALAVLGFLAIPAPAQAQTVYYLHTDIQGSVVAVTDANRNVVERRVYEPYGLPRAPIADGPGYTGHDHDGDSGLIYAQQRYYDPQVGQFLSVDPVGVDPAGGANFNRYWYGNDNPYKFVDPDGRISVCANLGRRCENGQLVTGSGKPALVRWMRSATQDENPADQSHLSTAEQRRVDKDLARVRDSFYRKDSTFGSPSSAARALHHALYRIGLENGIEIAATIYAELAETTRYYVRNIVTQYLRNRVIPVIERRFGQPVATYHVEGPVDKPFHDDDILRDNDDGVAGFVSANGRLYQHSGTRDSVKCVSGCD